MGMEGSPCSGTENIRQSSSTNGDTNPIAIHHRRRIQYNRVEGTLRAKLNNTRVKVIGREKLPGSDSSKGKVRNFMDYAKKSAYVLAFTAIVFVFKLQEEKPSCTSRTRMLIRQVDNRLRRTRSKDMSSKLEIGCAQPAGLGGG